MTPIAHIRKAVLKMSQVEFASLAGVNQSTVSRWERGQLRPTHEEMQRIRAEALRREIVWSDGWFFVVPENRAGAAA